MKVDIYDDTTENRVVVQARVSKPELMREAMNPERLMAEVRYQIAAKLTDVVMERLKPTLDAMFDARYKEPT
jgi:hypothetical protein